MYCNVELLESATLLKSWTSYSQTTKSDYPNHPLLTSNEELGWTLNGGHYWHYPVAVYHRPETRDHGVLWSMQPPYHCFSVFMFNKGVITIG